VTPVCRRAGAFDVFFGGRAEAFDIFVARFTSCELRIDEEHWYILVLFANS